MERPSHADSSRSLKPLLPHQAATTPRFTGQEGLSRRPRSSLLGCRSRLVVAAAAAAAAASALFVPVTASEDSTKEAPWALLPNRQLSISVGEEDLDEPLCGYSKLTLDEDPVRRHCLRQCRIESDGQIRPTFSEWEAYCRETAAMEVWDGECEDYLACTFGCEIWGGDRNAFLKLGPEERYEFLLDTKADMYGSGITQEQRCTLDKCHSYCMRASLDSCREAQWRQDCLAGNPLLYDCDVDCDSANRSVLPGALTALTLIVLKTIF